MPPKPKNLVDLNTQKTMEGTMANGGFPTMVRSARDTSTSIKEGRMKVDAGMKKKKKALISAAMKNLC